MLAKGAGNFLLVGQASRLCSRDACCLRDGAHSYRLAVLVRGDFSSLLIIMMIMALDYAMRK